MMLKRLNIVTSCCAAGVIALWCVVPGSRVAAQATADDPVKVLVGRLDLDKYKATIKALTLFGDRLQGTDRNKAAIEWIAETLKSYGCTPERLQYTYAPAAPAQPATPAAAPPPLQMILFLSPRPTAATRPEVPSLWQQPSMLSAHKLMSPQ